MKVYWQRWDIINENELSEPEYSGRRRSDAIRETNPDARAEWYGEVEIQTECVITESEAAKILVKAAAIIGLRFDNIQLPCDKCAKLHSWAYAAYRLLNAEYGGVQIPNGPPSVCTHQPRDYIDVSLSPDGPWTRFRVQRVVELRHKLVEMPVVSSVEFELIEGEEPEEGVEFELVTEPFDPQTIYESQFGDDDTVESVEAIRFSPPAKEPNVLRKPCLICSGRGRTPSEEAYMQMQNRTCGYCHGTGNR